MHLLEPELVELALGGIDQVFEMPGRGGPPIREMWREAA
jgi:hypothetical protein